jgi:predicted lipoprotein with Yx(FWY)xxD motif
MKRVMSLIALFMAIMLLLAACPAPAAAPGTGTATEGTATEAAETPMSETTSAMTGTMEMTATTGMTDTMDMTGTAEMTGTEAMTDTGDMTDTAGMGDMTGLVMMAPSAELGEILTDSEGRTLYLFTQDTADASACNDQCAENWPPLTTDGEGIASEGVDEALLGTITRDDGTTQVTYNGHPLYYYAKDAAPGDTTGHTVGDVWYAVDAAGNQVE